MSPKQMLLSCKQVLTSQVKKLVLSSWRKPTPIQHSAHLRSEELESRCVPAVFLWNPWLPKAINPGNLFDVIDAGLGAALGKTPLKQEWLWSDPDNWRESDPLEGWVPTDRTPGDDPQESDDVRFVGELKYQIFHTFSTTNKVILANKPCVLDEARTLKSVRIDSNYTATISLPNTLTITGSLSMASPATLSGAGTLHLAGQAYFFWEAGRLNLDGGQWVPGRGVHVGPQAKMQIEEAYGVDEGPTLDSTIVTVQGILNWT